MKMEAWVCHQVETSFLQLENESTESQRHVSRLIRMLRSHELEITVPTYVSLNIDTNYCVVCAPLLHELYIICKYFYARVSLHKCLAPKKI